LAFDRFEVLTTYASLARAKKMGPYSSLIETYLKIVYLIVYASIVGLGAGFDMCLTIYYLTTVSRNMVLQYEASSA
jgi:hypothetical protein